MANLDEKTCGSMCCHCGDGIPYNKSYFCCLHCDLYFCNACHGRHPRTHLSAFKRVIDKATARNTPPDEKGCLVCLKMVHCRVQCDDCNIGVCFGCWPDALSSFIEHEHKSLTFIRIPDDNGLEAYDLSCRTCKSGFTIVHCSRCSEGVMEGERVYECKECLKLYDHTPTLCEICLPAGLGDHDPMHNFVSFRYTKRSGADERHLGIQCLECSESFEHLDTKTIVRHPHGTFEISMGSLEMEKLAYEAYRKCARHSVKKVDQAAEDLHDGEMGCHCCWERFTKDPRTYFCPQCGFSSCANCFETGVTNHPHPLIRMWITKTVAPDNFWVTLVDGSHRSCDICKEKFRPAITPHMQCISCQDYDICQDCISKTSITVEHQGCPELPEMIYFDPEPRGEEWIDEQVGLADAYIARQEAEEEQRRAEEQAERRAQRPSGTRLLSAPRAQPLYNNRVPSPSPARPAPSFLAPPAQTPVQKRKSSSSLGTALLKFGAAVVNAEMRQVSLGNGGGGGYVDNSGSGAMDMSSFWAPIQSAASDPIQ